LAAIASLLPDIDPPPGRTGRLFWFVSHFLGEPVYEAFLYSLW
jgi:hypothetical protein